MVYSNTVQAVFLDRPNRFIAHVRIGDEIHTVHVKNTGRCRELLLPGAEVILQHSDASNRKTAYDLICVYKPNLGWVNIDSQVPNTVVSEWLHSQAFDVIRPEYTFGNSRVDFYLEKGDEKYLLEVKGCTLEMDGKGYFPDAPSLRAAKHCRELAEASCMGYHCYIAFVIAMEQVNHVYPHTDRDPDFATALAEAQAAGVEILHIPCKVSQDAIYVSPSYSYTIDK